MLEKVISFIDSGQQTVIDLQRVLVAAPALGPDNGGTGERDKADKLKEFLAGAGFSAVAEYNAPDPRVPCGHRPNLVLTLPGKDASRTFWVISHLDIVPPGDLSLWKTDPYALAVEGDIVRGRGVEDNHQGIVSSVLLAMALRSLDAVPPINFGMLFVSDEETGSAYGLDYVAENHSSLFRKNDLFLVPDFGVPSAELVEVAEKSILWIKITVHGKQCHASKPDDGVNSLTAAAAFILKVAELRKRYAGRDELFHPATSTFEPTKKEANVEGINIIPGRDVFFVDCRVLPDINLDDVLASLRSIGDDITRDYGVRIDYEAVQKAQAAPPTREDSEIVTRILPAIREVYGGTPQPAGIGGGTVAAFLRRRGHAAVVWAGLEDNPHQPNERSSIAKTIGNAKVMARVLFGP